jgi:hypothetical protein
MLQFPPPPVIFIVEIVNHNVLGRNNSGQEEPRSSLRAGPKEGSRMIPKELKAGFGGVILTGVEFFSLLKIDRARET